MLHNLPFSRTLVVNSTQMQDSVYNDPVQLRIIRLTELFGVGTNRIQTDEKITRQLVTFRIIESYDVRIIIVLQILAVHFQDLLIVAEDI